MKTLKHPKVDPILLGVGKLMFAMMTCCELYYFSAFMTDSALLSAAITSMILTVTSVIDFILSFFLGVFIEKIRLPWGKNRSWLFVSPIIVLVFGTLFFVRVSDNEMVSAVVIIISFVISHLFWSIGEASINTMPLHMTDDQKERASLSTWLGRGSMGNTLLFGIIASPILSAFASTGHQYMWLQLICGIVYLIFFWIVFFDTKGCDVTPKKGEGGAGTSLNLGKAFRYSFTNPYLILSIILVMGTYCYMMLGSAAMYYWFTYTLGGTLLGIMSLVISLNSCMRLIGSFVIVPLLMKATKQNKKMVAVIGFIAMAILFFINYILPIGAWGHVILFLCAGLFGSCPLAVWIGLYTDCAVYSEYKAGEDVKPFVMSLSIMPVKLGIVIRSVIVSAVLMSIGYSATATDTSGYAAAFNVEMLLIPAIICLVVGLVYLFGYHLSNDKVAQMQKEIEERYAQRDAAAAAEAK